MTSYLFADSMVGMTATTTALTITAVLAIVIILLLVWSRDVISDIMTNRRDQRDHELMLAARQHTHEIQSQEAALDQAQTQAVMQHTHEREMHQREWAARLQFEEDLRNLRNPKPETEQHGEVVGVTTEGKVTYPSGPDKPGPYL